MARCRVLGWCAIPARVRATGNDGRRVSRPLPDWFQQEIDRVTTRHGLAGSHGYVAEWTSSDEHGRAHSAAEVAAAVAEEVPAGWDRGG